MLRRIPQSEYLEPEDLQLCRRVFEQACAEIGFDPSSAQSEALATAVLGIFQSGIGEEADLQDRIRQHIA
ncbi:MAG: hypothetical protein EOQ50_10320 [Mesorhizobium sp.]|uniref:hypothetical protein n=1 Tax=Mesorhizobium sp. TaxID=1871066 RepID=UPI000FE7F00C|nr:hypothetical protein [Mesorhizobium sp.]RWB75868.1 MAG: hypothetical protein EOQ50_10320 [Mesorhizobium sp.]